MPYITPQARHEMLWEKRAPEVAGELNYCITKLILEYFNTHHDYQGINDIVGALEGAKLEFYRRHVVPYEDVKIEVNGDVT